MKYVLSGASLFFEPLRRNGAFFVFMYALGLACSWLDYSSSHYDALYAELFIDVYALCVVLALLPGRIRLWTRRVLYVILYAVAFIDLYCLVKFDSTLTPTMLMLVGETDPREASEFLSTFLDPSLASTPVGWLLLLLFAHVIFTLRHKLWRAFRLPHVKLPTIRWRRNREGAVAGVLVMVILSLAWPKSAGNKQAVAKIMSVPSLGDIERLLATRGHAVMYEPVYRLAFSVRSNNLANKQVNTLLKASAKVRVDSCKFTTPRIVLIIGESYGRHHSQLYGYRMPTTPRQRRLMRRGELVRFDDVVTPFNLTSYVFKNVLSMHVVGQQGDWCDYPLFPQIFRKAGYHVTFITNQFLSKAKEEVYDFSGGFFLNDPTLSEQEFDTRNTSLHTYDEGLLDDYAALKREDTDHNLTIIHLLGQHVTYPDRYPADRRKFTKDDYGWRTELNDKQRAVLADYDNAVLYNDSIVDQIISRFEDRNAVIIYVPDHGEECYEGNVHFYGRMHSTEITKRLAREEFDIPFWIWCSHSYMVAHPETYNRIVRAKNRRYMTDALPHLLLSIAGIGTKVYRPELDLISDEYDEHRPRILKNTTDYDALFAP